MIPDKMPPHNRTFLQNNSYSLNDFSGTTIRCKLTAVFEPSLQSFIVSNDNQLTVKVSDYSQAILTVCAVATAQQIKPFACVPMGFLGYDVNFDVNPRYICLIIQWLQLRF